MEENHYCKRENLEPDPEKIPPHTLIYANSDGRRFIISTTASENTLGSAGPQEPGTQTFWEIDEHGTPIGNGERCEVTWEGNAAVRYTTEDGAIIEPARDEEQQYIHYRDIVNQPET